MTAGAPQMSYEISSNKSLHFSKLLVITFIPFVLVPSVLSFSHSSDVCFSTPSSLFPQQSKTNVSESLYKPLKH